MLADALLALSYGDVRGRLQLLEAVSSLQLLERLQLMLLLLKVLRLIIASGVTAGEEVLRLLDTVISSWTC